MTKNLDLDGLQSIANNYDLFYIDLWGVIHNGIKLHNSAIETLNELKKKNKSFILLTNAPRPNATVNKFLEKKVIGENFTKFIVFKSGSIEPEMAWVEIGISDLSRVEIKEGLNKGDSVFVLPSKGLVDRQERFRQRVKSWG